MKIKELKDLKTKELKDLLGLVAKKKVELLKNAVKIAGGKEKDIKKNWTLRKEISQILTIVNTKK